MQQHPGAALAGIADTSQAAREFARSAEVPFVVEAWVDEQSGDNEDEGGPI